MRRQVAAGWAALLLLLSGCGVEDPPAADPSATPSSAPSSDSATPSEAPVEPASTLSPSEPAATKRPRQHDVLAISVDGLNVDALRQLGPGGAPAFYRLLEEGAATLNARTAVEQTVTLPNHTGMLTSRRVDAARGGHGVTWNEDLPGSVVPGQGNGVESLFDVVADSGGSAALYAGKDKFAIFGRSWPDALDEFVIETDHDALVAEVRTDLAEERRRLRFLHLALPDNAGHATGFMSPTYVAAVRDTDELLGALLETVEGSRRLERRTTIVLTADHGGVPGATTHGDASAYQNYRVPFVVWGFGIDAADLYRLNPDYRDPGLGQPSYDGPQPVRNADLANLVTALLGLGPVPGSEVNADQELDVTER